MSTIRPPSNPPPPVPKLPPKISSQESPLVLYDKLLQGILILFILNKKRSPSEK